MVANAAALLAARILVAALGWAGTVVLVRTLSVADYGRFTLVFSVLGVLGIVTDMSIGRAALSGILGHPDGRAEFTGNYVLLRACLGVVGYGLGVGFVAAAGYDATVVTATAVAGLVVVLATPSNAYLTVFQAHQRLRGVALLQAAGRVVQLTLIAAIAAAGGSLVAFVLPAVAAEVVILGWIGPAAHRVAAIRYPVRVRLWGALLREAAPLSVGAALATLYYRVDTIMLSWLADFHAVALYGVASKFVDVLHYAATAVTTSLLPLLVASWPGRAAETREHLRRAATILLGIGGLVAAEAVVFARPVVELLYGGAYAEAGTATALVVSGEAVAFVTALALATLVATGQNRRYPAVALGGLVLNVGLNLALIPAAGYLGSAVATLVTDAAVAVFMCGVVARTTGLRPLPRPPLAWLGAATAATGLTAWALAPLLAWPAAAAVALGVHVGVLALPRGPLSRLRRSPSSGPGAAPAQPARRA